MKTEGAIVKECSKYKGDETQKYIGQYVKFIGWGNGTRICKCADGTNRAFAEKELEPLLMYGPERPKSWKMTLKELRMAIETNETVYLSHTLGKTMKHYYEAKVRRVVVSEISYRVEGIDNVFNVAVRITKGINEGTKFSFRYKESEGMPKGETYCLHLTPPEGYGEQ
jgi:hypothetical protein